MPIETLAVDLLEDTSIAETATLADFNLSGTDQMAMLAIQIEDRTNVVLKPGEISPHTTVKELREKVSMRTMGNLWSRPDTREQIRTGFWSRPSLNKTGFGNSSFLPVF